MLTKPTACKQEKGFDFLLIVNKSAWQVARMCLGMRQDNGLFWVEKLSNTKTKNGLKTMSRLMLAFGCAAGKKLSNPQALSLHLRDVNSPDVYSICAEVCRFE